MGSDNGSSYQKKYQEISAEDSDLSHNTNDGLSPSRIRRLVIIGALIAAAVGSYFAITLTRGSASANIEKTISTSKTVQVKKNGKLRLFDHLSTLIRVFDTWFMSVCLLHC